MFETNLSILFFFLLWDCTDWVVRMCVCVCLCDLFAFAILLSNYNQCTDKRWQKVHRNRFCSYLKVTSAFVCTIEVNLFGLYKMSQLLRCFSLAARAMPFTKNRCDKIVCYKWMRSMPSSIQLYRKIFFKTMLLRSYVIWFCLANHITGKFKFVLFIFYMNCIQKPE